MTDSYLHPKVVSFINYFYDYIHKNDPDIRMEIYIYSPSVKADFLCIRIFKKEYKLYSIEKHHSTQAIIDDFINAENESFRMLKDFLNGCEYIDKQIET